MNDQNFFISLAKEEFCYLTTTGRVTGRPHEIEIWFGLRGSTVYMLSGSHTSDWVKNLLKDPAVTVRIGKQTFPGSARLVQDKAEDTMARFLVAEKYHELEDDQTLDEWARTALPVAVDLTLKQS